MELRHLLALCYPHHIAGLSIFYAEAINSPNRGFFKNSMGDLLPTLRILGRLYNFCNFVIIFSLIKSEWYIAEWHILQIQNSDTKPKNYISKKFGQTHYTKKSFLLMVYIGTFWLLWEFQNEIDLKLA